MCTARAARRGSRWVAAARPGSAAAWQCDPGSHPGSSEIDGNSTLDFSGLWILFQLCQSGNEMTVTWRGVEEFSGLKHSVFCIDRFLDTGSFKVSWCRGSWLQVWMVFMRALLWSSLLVTVPWNAIHFCSVTTKRHPSWTMKFVRDYDVKLKITVSLLTKAPSTFWTF